ncbi:hypothetical protein VNI00_003616 [Paramarasmius palmivorus]|uniref:Uncharacterized protein n=1 Tax=Paramarasmius palmivorus TaxID=297713 RepID=A0AAW0DS56_9AGAR
MSALHIICSDDLCGPLLFEPRTGDPRPGDILSIPSSVLAPFYQLLNGDTSKLKYNKGDRPFIILDQTPDSRFKGCLMATFEDSDTIDNKFPGMFQVFTCDVFNLGDPNPPTEQHIHTVPPWDIHKRQYIVALAMTLDIAPNTPRWRTGNMPPDAGFYVEKQSLDKLRQRCLRSVGVWDDVMPKGLKKRAREEKECLTKLKNASKQHSKSTKTGHGRRFKNVQPRAAASTYHESYISSKIIVGPDNLPWRVK